MVRKQKNEVLMSRSEPPLSALEEIRQLNRLFLDFARQQPAVAIDRFGLSSNVARLLKTATADQIDRAAEFPRALFRLRLPPTTADCVIDPRALAGEPGERVLELVLLHSARSLSRMSGYSARLLLRLTDHDVSRLRLAEVDEVVFMSFGADVIQAAFDGIDWIWHELLTEGRPEYRRRLLLIGLQPDFSIQPVTALG